MLYWIFGFLPLTSVTIEQIYLKYRKNSGIIKIECFLVKSS
jgi:hypothetical protein